MGPFRSFIHTGRPTGRDRAPVCSTEDEGPGDGTLPLLPRRAQSGAAGHSTDVQTVSGPAWCPLVLTQLLTLSTTSQNCHPSTLRT